MVCNPCSSLNIGTALIWIRSCSLKHKGGQVWLKGCRLDTHLVRGASQNRHAHFVISGDLDSGGNLIELVSDCSDSRHCTNAMITSITDASPYKKIIKYACHAIFVKNFPRSRRYKHVTFVDKFGVPALYFTYD